MNYRIWRILKESYEQCQYLHCWNWNTHIGPSFIVYTWSKYTFNHYQLKWFTSHLFNRMTRQMRKRIWRESLQLKFTEYFLYPRYCAKYSNDKVLMSIQRATRTIFLGKRKIPRELRSKYRQMTIKAIILYEMLSWFKMNLKLQFVHFRTFLEHVIYAKNWEYGTLRGNMCLCKPW